MDGVELLKKKDEIQAITNTKSLSSDNLNLRIEGKDCSKCGEHKPYTEFRKDHYQKDGYQTACKNCNDFNLPQTAITLFKKEIKPLLKKAGKPLHIDEIHEGINTSYKTTYVSVLLSKFKKKGWLYGWPVGGVKGGKKVYSLISEQEYLRQHYNPEESGVAWIDDEELLKQCSKCEDILPESYFNKSHICHICESKKVKKSKEQNNLEKVEINTTTDPEPPTDENEMLIKLFLNSKRIEGCTEKTLDFYEISCNNLLKIGKNIKKITTEDLRNFFGEMSTQMKKISMDNHRRNLSSFFRFLEEEEYIDKNPIRRIKRIKYPKLVKNAFTNEELFLIRESCENNRDRAIIELLSSSGIRVGELTNIKIDEVNFDHKEIIVFGKGEKERIVYFNDTSKMHILKYLSERTDNNKYLFVSLNKPHARLSIGGVETCLRKLGKKLGFRVYPHRFRRTMATNAIDKGMSLEQVQQLLGHVNMDTTLVYAKVKQSNVKFSHDKYLGG